jgi:hypothetical protein
MATLGEGGEVVVTLKDVYIEVRRLQDTVATMTPLATQLADHENRLRSTERWRYSLPVSLLLAIGSSALATVELITHH